VTSRRAQPKMGSAPPWPTSGRAAEPGAGSARSQAQAGTTAMIAGAEPVRLRTWADSLARCSFSGLASAIASFASASIARSARRASSGGAFAATSLIACKVRC
jgi:hypothetical protein